MLSRADNNWLEMSTDKVINSVLKYFESKGIVPDASTMIPYAGANAYELANLLCKDPQLLVQSIQESLGGGR